MQNDKQLQNSNRITSSDNIIDNSNMYSSINGTNCNSIYTFESSKMVKNRINEITDDNDKININIYRFKFLDDFIEELYKFSKIHQYDERKDFKEAWNVWIEENNEIIELETRRLINLGYDGDVLDKMFKSARYYFRKKSTEKKEPVKRRNYCGVLKELIETMDNHIKNNINSDDYKPSAGFDDFCKNNVEVLKDQIKLLCNNGFSDVSEIKNKIKKTYKNRYFLMINK
jgi:hypothetical protein